MNGIENVLGMTASAMSFIIFVPSAVSVWRNRNDPHALKGASILMNVFLMVNAVLWGLYGWVTHAFWVAAPGLVNFPLALLSIVFIVRSRGTARPHGSMVRAPS